MTINESEKDFIKNVIENILKEQHSDYRKQSVRDMHNRLNFACPFCGDSVDNPLAKRGNLFLDSLFYHCYNDGCNSHMPLTTFLKRFGYNYSSDSKFIYDYINNSHENYNKYKIKNINRSLFPEIEDLGITFEEFYKTYNAKPISKNSSVYLYLKGRLLNTRLDLFAINETTNQLFILNYNHFNKKIISFQIRKLNKYNNNKYLTYNIERINTDLGRDIILKVEEFSNMSKINKLSTVFNLLNIDFRKEITIFEGPLDSIFIPNSIGLASISRDKEAFLDLPYKRFLLDNDKAGKLESIKLIRDGNKVFLWKKFIKDFKINDYIKDKTDNKKDLNDIIKLCFKYKLDAYKHINEYFSDSPYHILLI